MRVYKNWESQEGEEREGRDRSRSEDESGSGSESDDESGGSSDDDEDVNTANDFFSDAKRLFPWQDNVKEILKNIWESIEREDGEEQQLQAISIFFRELIFWKVRGKIFDSTLMHFLAVLGINEDTNRSRGGNDFSYMLAGVVYCSRVLAVEILLPSVERDEQTVDDDRRFLQQRQEYLADDSFSPMSKMLSLLAYGKHIALNHGNAGAVLWSRDGKEMAIRGMPIRLTQFQKMVHDVVREAEDMLWRKLMWTKYRERVEIPLDKLTDDVTFTKRGISFVNNGKERSRGQAGVDVDPGVRYSGRKKDAPPRRVGDATGACISTRGRSIPRDSIALCALDRWTTRTRDRDQHGAVPERVRAGPQCLRDTRADSGRHPISQVTVAAGQCRR